MAVESKMTVESRFRPTRFNEKQADANYEFTYKCEELEGMMHWTIADSREKSIAMTKLEEFHLWIVKALKESPRTFKEDK